MSDSAEEGLDSKSPLPSQLSVHSARPRSQASSAETCVVIGAGPAGLTAAYELSKSGLPTTVLESSAVPGGLARTEHYKGYRFDIGGHRFFTKLNIVDEIWRELLGNDFLSRPRLSRIYYNGRFFKYPLEPMDALSQLGLWEAMACAASFLRVRFFPIRPEKTFDLWVSNRFGRRLFDTFFRTYTEKVWGMPCSEIDAEWAAQRIRGLDALALIKQMLLPAPKDKGRVVKSLIDSFHYPRLGPGMMWEECARRVANLGGKLLYNSTVARIEWEPQRVVAVLAAGGERYEASQFISTMPIQQLLQAFDPPPPDEVLKAGERLRYRDFLTVALILRRAHVFPDNWIYLHDPGVKVGRIQNYKNWSPDMVPSEETTCLGLEYFCSQGDQLWNLDDAELVRLASRELAQLGIAGDAEIVDGTVVRAQQAYPVYDAEYRSCLATIRAFLDKFGNLQLVGRNGMHHYNNQDHSMFTGLLAARNILGENHDVWAVNSDFEYHESGTVSGDDKLDALRSSQPRVPRNSRANASSLRIPGEGERDSGANVKTIPG